MRLYADGKLSAKSMHEVEKHMLECGLCSAAMDGFTTRRSKNIEKVSSNVHRRLAVYMNTPPPIPFMKRFGLAISAAVVLLVTGGGIIWWMLSSSAQPRPAAPHDTTQQQPHGSEPAPAVPAPQAVLEEPRYTAVAESRPAAEVKNPPAETAIKSPPAKETTLPASTPPVAEPAAAKTTTEPVAAPQPAPASTRTPGPNTSPVRVKHVTLYSKTTHVDGSGRSEGGSGGQLGPSKPRSGGFELDEMPHFPGGDAELKNYFLTNLKPIITNREQLKRLSTGLSFVVNAKTGEVSLAELSFSISPEVDAEIMRVVKAMPRWTPGSKRGLIDVRLGITFE
ncbi:MAG: zf-HC2 domain-containing protein [Bacteroidetes bacterium]|nr:zf-HC2 domain-containing protein [Bacteroidota bacterium]